MKNENYARQTTSISMIIYEDPYILAVNKPSALLVHPSKEAGQEKECLLFQLRRQTGNWLYPIHRLDRATSGLILFAKTDKAAKDFSQMFARRLVSKSYLAIVRGWASDAGSIDTPLKRLDRLESDKIDALTNYSCLARIQLDEQLDTVQTSRYSLLLVQPVTGRQHQIRRHLKHIHHPIIGDTRYGKGDQNRFFRKRFGIDRLLLHSLSLQFQHPFLHKNVVLRAEADPVFHRLFPEYKDH